MWLLPKEDENRIRNYFGCGFHFVSPFGGHLHLLTCSTHYEITLSSYPLRLANEDKGISPSLKQKGFLLW